LAPGGGLGGPEGDSAVLEASVGEEYAQWQFWIAEGVADFLISFFSDRAANAAGREAVLSAQFDPNQVVKNIQGMDRDGNIDRGWQMSDGSAFFDTDGNNVPDLRMWTDRAGNVWADEGNGRHLVRGAS
jgi:hypothetical protein